MAGQNTKGKRPEVWIGLVEVLPLEGCDMLEGAGGAVVNILTWALNVSEYETKVHTLTESLNLEVVGIEDPEPIRHRAADDEFDPDMQDIIKRVRENPDAIIYSTFHCYPPH